MAKITYADKVKIKDIPVAEVNKFTDANANEIKAVVNGLDDNIILIENDINNIETNIINLQTGNIGGNINVSAIWTSGLSFYCTAENYPIIDTYYSATSNTITLPNSDDILDRIDLIVASKLGVISSITGTLATTELVVPPDYDPSTYYVIKQVIVRALATIPTDNNGTTVSTETVYANGTGETTEWTFSSNSGTVVNSGGVINATNPTSTSKATLTNDVDITNLSSDKQWSLSFKITLKASLGSSYIFIKLLNSSGQSMVNTLLINNGKYGFNANSLVEQSITIDGSDFSFVSLGNIRGVQIYPFKSFAGYYLDNIKFNIGSATNVVTPYEIPTLQQVTDKGNTTTNSILIDGGSDKYFEIVSLGEGTYIDFENVSIYTGSDSIGMNGGSGNPFIEYSQSDGSLQIKAEQNTGDNTLVFPAKSGTIATLDDVTGADTVGYSELKPAFKTIIYLGNVSGTVNLDFDLAVKYKLNMTGNTTLTFSNVTNYVGIKTQQLEVTSNSDTYTLAYPSGVDVANDLIDVDLTATNYITFFPHTATIFQSSVKVV